MSPLSSREWTVHTKSVTFLFDRPKQTVTLDACLSVPFNVLIYTHLILSTQPSIRNEWEGYSCWTSGLVLVTTVICIRLLLQSF